MNKIKSLDDLRRMRADLRHAMDMREKSESPESIVQIRVAMGTCGITAGAVKVMNALLGEIQKENVGAIVTQTGCMGYCYAEPTVEVHKPGQEPVVFGDVDEDRARQIVDKYILGGELLDGIIPPQHKELK